MKLVRMLISALRTGITQGIEKYLSSQPPDRLVILADVHCPTDQEVKVRIRGWFLDGIEFAISQVAQAWREAKAQEVTGTKHLVGITASIRVMFADIQISFMIEQPGVLHTASP